MNHSHQLIARGYPGRVSPPAFSYLLSSGALFKQAYNAGLVSGLRRLGAPSNTPETETAPLILDFTPSFEGVAPASGAQNSIETLPSAFRGGLGKSLGYGWTEADTENALSFSTTGSVGKNGAHCIRFYLERPALKIEDDDNALGAGALWQYRFGAWQLQARDGRFEIMRRTPQWTQELEDSLQQTERQRGSDGATVAAIKAEIYADCADLNFGEVYNSVHCLTFIAEPGPGALHIFSLSGEYARVEHSQIRDLRLTPTDSLESTGQASVGAVWNRFTRGHRSRGHLWFAQWGAPEFDNIAQILTPRQKNGYFTDGLGDCNRSGIWDLSAPGTGATLEYEELNQVEFRFKLTLTGDGSGTPILYSAQAVLDPGERNGFDDVYWDSDDYRRPSGSTMIKGVYPQFEGARRVYKVEIWDSYGTALEEKSGFGLHLLEGRICDLKTNGEFDIKGGLITDAKIGPMASVEQNIHRANATKADSLITLTVADGHALLDEAEVKVDAAGDDRDGNEWLRFWLKNAGFRDSELTQIPTTFEANLGFGEKLSKIESAAWGEAPRERPAIGAKIGDYLRDFTADYGVGALLTHGKNGWQFDRFGTNLRNWNGHAVEFWGKGGGRGNPENYPGRLAVLESFEIARDWTDTFNEWTVEGQALPDGTIVSDTFSLPASQNPAAWNNPKGGNHVGRVRSAPIYRNAALRNKEQCYRAARGRAALAGGAPGRYYFFETFYHWFLRPYDVIRVFGIPCRIDKIPGADSARDRMQIAAREL